MKHLERLFFLSILITGFIWLMGCGGGASLTQAETLTDELQKQQAILANMRELADTLSVSRVVEADNFAFFREVNAMTDEEIETASASFDEAGTAIGVLFDDMGNFLNKVGGTLKWLWPF
jgi:hypothetical protein|tara:strand:- start:87 stop:446 length:360 start_codon:yes stop_codon:yes gene_type:complete